jgi:acetyl-CoA C-acetyltransferase
LILPRCAQAAIENAEQSCSVEFGYPFSTIGAWILSRAIKGLSSQPNGSRAIISICADGGLGTVALLQS